MYTNKTIQNVNIGICGSILRSTPLGRVQSAVRYSLLADEAADISNKEQLAVCLRYLDVTSAKPMRGFLPLASLIPVFQVKLLPIVSWGCWNLGNCQLPIWLDRHTMKRDQWPEAQSS